MAVYAYRNQKNWAGFLESSGACKESSEKLLYIRIMNEIASFNQLQKIIKSRAHTENAKCSKIPTQLRCERARPLYFMKIWKFTTRFATSLILDRCMMADQTQRISFLLYFQIMEKRLADAYKLLLIQDICVKSDILFMLACLVTIIYWKIVRRV